MEKRILTAALVAAAVAVPATAFAGPKLQEFERAIPSDAVEIETIFRAFMDQIGTDTATIKAVQVECGLPPIGARLDVSPKTRDCLRRYAEVMSRARKDAAADRAAIEAELDATRGRAIGCDEALGDCRDALAAAESERDEALERARSGAVGEDYGELEGICTKVDLSQFVGTCDPVTQNARCVPDEDAQLGFTIACVPKQVHGEVASLTIRPDGSADAQFNVTAQNGTLQPAVLPWQVPPRPFPELPGTCDGAGGALMCYVLPLAAVVVGGLLIADAASPDFNLVTVQR